MNALDTVVIPLIVVGAVFFIGLVVFAVMRERAILEFTVRVKSRKDFGNFQPDSYMLTVSEDQLDQLESLIDGESKKRNFRLSWGYTTPSGKSSYSNSKRYSLDEVRQYVDQLKPLYQAGKSKVNALNEMYAKQLQLGREVEDSIPKIYCYSIPSDSHQGLVKVGYAKNNAHKRIDQQFRTAARLKVNYKIHFIMPALTVTGERFMDHPVHRLLKNAGVSNPEGEWFACSVRTAEQAVKAVQSNRTSL